MSAAHSADTGWGCGCWVALCFIFSFLWSFLFFKEKLKMGHSLAWYVPLPRPPLPP